MVTFNRSDLDFVLTQLKLAEAGQAPVNPHLPFGIRHVDGSDNSSVDGQAQFGSTDQVFPTLTNPVFQSADPSFFGPPGAPTSYASTSGMVFDADPRIISNLISDQTATNPAALEASEKAAGQLGTGYQHSLPGPDGVRGTPDDTAGNLSTPDAIENGSLFINNVTPDNGLSAPFNSLFTLFGQFFDHGLDLIEKGGSGTVIIPLQPDDPLYDPASATNFMALTRATNEPGPDGQLGTADDIHANRNLVTPFVDQNQTYTSHPAHQVFLREYIVGSDGSIHATGRLLEGMRPDGSRGGEPTWADVKANALTLGIILNDTLDVINVPLIKADAYGNFVPDPGTGLAQLVIDLGPDGQYGTGDDVVVHGTRDPDGTVHPVTTDGALRTGHAFLNDIAHSANPIADSGHFLLPDSDGIVNDAEHPIVSGHFDVDLLNQHFIAGDGRANENIGLTAVHEIFHDEHNRLVEQVKELIRSELAKGDTAFASEWVLPRTNLSDGIQDDEWNGERLFQVAKFGTETQYQHLVFEEFARKISPSIHLFGNVNVHLDAAITGEFANAVYRFGHSMLDETVNRYVLQGAFLDGSGLPTNIDTGVPNPLAGTPTLDAHGRPVLDQIGLIAAFTNPLEFSRHGGSAAAEIAAGAANQVGNEIDEFVTGALRDNLLGLPLDLAALNIARGRETGVAPLNLVRNQIYSQTHDAGLKPYASWSEFGQYLKHEASLINFVAAYGTHSSIVNATTLAEKREAALTLVRRGADGFVSSSFAYIDVATGELTHTAQHVDNDGSIIANIANIDFASDQAIADANAFMHSRGAYSIVTDPAALVANPSALRDASGKIPFWSTGNITGLDAVDLWIGGLAEKQSLFGGLLGSTFDFIFRQQLENLQDGDRLYYLPRLEGTHFLNEIENNSFADMIMRNTGARHLSASVFLVPEYVVEAGSIDPDRLETWTRNPETGKLLVEASWLTDQQGHRVKGSDGADIRSIHFIGDENFLGNTMVLGGTDSDDMLRAGNADDDTVYGDGGNDTIDGGDGNDFLYGGAGNDYITDTAGDDVIHGDAGDDWIDGGAGDDILFGNDGNDTLNGGRGIDDIQGGEGSDVILGGEGDDEIQGNEGDDWIEGGQGGDLLVGDAGAPTGQLPLYESNDVLIGGTWVRFDPAGHPLPDGSNVVANNGGDRMQGFSGDDIMVGGGGFNRFEGRKGFDWASFEFDTLGVEVDMTRKDFILDAPPQSPDAIRDVFIETEGLSGSSYNDNLIGSNDATPDSTNELSNTNLILELGTFFSPGSPVHFSGGNIILGGGGSDTISGGGGNDILDGDAFLHVALDGGTIVREILNGGRVGDVDTAVYHDVASNYVVGQVAPDGRGWDGLDGEGFFSVVHVVSAGGGAAQAGGITTVVNDGADKVRNIERLAFSDGTHLVNEFVPAVKAINQLPFGEVTISGAAVVGQKLTADSSLFDLDPNPFAPTPVTNATYQWEYLDPARGEWVPITGATSKDYTAGSFVVGQPLRVVASYVDGLGFQERVASAQTAPVTSPPNVNTAPFVIPQQGRVGLPDTTILADSPVNLFLPVTATFGDAQTPANQLVYTVALSNGDPLSAIGLSVVDQVATNGALLITGMLSGASGPVDIRVKATDLGPGDPLTVTDTFTINVVRPSPGSHAVLSGTLQDGYVAGATVFMDSNGDGIRQSFEAQTTTDAIGHFTLAGKPGELIAYGGPGAVDIATGLSFDHVFRAPVGATVVTALTTLLSALIDRGFTSADASSRLKAALGIGDAADIMHLDPIAAVQSPDQDTASAGSALLVAGSQVLNTIALIGAAVPNADPLHDLLDMISEGQPISLTQVSSVSDLLSRSGLQPPFSTAMAEIVASSNEALVGAATASSSGHDLLVTTTAINTVAQRDVADSLRAAFSLSELEAIQTAFTGDGLTSRIVRESAFVGDVDGDGVRDGVSRPVNSPPSGTVSIQGDLAVNNVVTVDTSALHDDDGLGQFHFRWERSDASFEWVQVGTDSPDYLLQETDRNAYMRVVVSYTDQRDTGETMIGLGSGPVGGPPVSDHSESDPPASDLPPPPNHAPTGITATGMSVRENAGAGTVVGILAAVDPDSGDNFVFRLEPGSTEFEIVGNELRVKNGAHLDASQERLRDLQIVVEDNGGMEFSTVLQVTVLSTVVTSSQSCTLEDGALKLVLLGKENITGIGNALPNILVGNAGSNVLDGGAGPDTMRGGAGNDIYFVDDAGDRVIEAPREGLDHVISRIDYSVRGQSIEKLTLVGDAVRATGNELSNFLVGNAGCNSLEGGAGNDTIDGGMGADTMRGGIGNDVYYVDDRHDRVLEKAGQGSDRVMSSVSFSLAGQNIEQLTLRGHENLHGTGNGLDNRIIGNSGSNRLSGLGGSDELVGGSGIDTLIGGTGDDSFVFRSLSDSGVGRNHRDVILDFGNHRERDVIDLHEIDADATRAGNQAFQWIVGEFSSAGQARAVIDHSGHTIVQLNTNHNLKSIEMEIELQTFTGLLGRGDFIL